MCHRRPSLWHDVRPGRGERLELQLGLRLGVERVLRQAERRGTPVVGARLPSVTEKRKKSNELIHQVAQEDWKLKLSYVSSSTAVISSSAGSDKA